MKPTEAEELMTRNARAVLEHIGRGAQWEFNDYLSIAWVARDMALAGDRHSRVEESFVLAEIALLAWRQVSGWEVASTTWLAELYFRRDILARFGTADNAEFGERKLRDRLEDMLVQIREQELRSYRDVPPQEILLRPAGREVLLRLRRINELAEAFDESTAHELFGSALAERLKFWRRELAE